MREHTADNDKVKLSEELIKNVTFSRHNLATDASFGEMNLVVCRNVLIYFNSELQNRVFHLFAESLVHRGFLALGSKENLEFSSEAHSFAAIDKPLRIYQKLTRASHSIEDENSEEVACESL